MIVYEQCGIRMRSEIPLDLPRVDAETQDVEVRWGDDAEDTTRLPEGNVVARDDSGPEEWWYVVAQTDDGYCVRFNRCGDVLISADLSDIRVRRDPTGRHDILPILLAGTICALLAVLRGSVVLHASAVAIDSTTLAFIGQSGRGKSTMAALMCLDGAELVTDDVLVIEPGPPITCIGGAAELRLRPKSAHLAERDVRTESRLTADDRRTYAPQRSPHGSLPLAALVVPSPDPSAEEVEISRLSSQQAFGALMAFPRIEGVRRPDLVARQFAVYGAIANAIPVYHAVVPWGPPFRDDIAVQIRRLIKDAEATPG